MLRTFFFGLSFLTDHRELGDALRDGLMLGLINACVVYIVIGWRSFLGGMAAGRRGPRPESCVE